MPFAVPDAGWHLLTGRKGAMTTKPKKAKKSIKPTSSNGPKSERSKPKAATSSHVPTPWLKLKQMWEAGESYDAMAKATDAHYSAHKPDPTKPTRAKIWKARNVGVNIDGKLVRFGERGKAKERLRKGKAEESKKGTGNKKASKTAVKPVTAPDTKVEPSSGTDLASKDSSA